MGPQTTTDPTPAPAITKPRAKKKAKKKVKKMTAKAAKPKAKVAAKKNGAPTSRKPALIEGSFPRGTKLEEFKDRKGEWRWRLVKRGKIVGAATEGYKRRAASRSNFKGLQDTLRQIALA